MMATVVNSCGLFGDEGFGHVFGVGLGVLEMLGDAGALLGSECGHECEHSAQGYGNIVDVVHESDSFTGERHGGPRSLESGFIVGHLRWGEPRIADFCGSEVGWGRCEGAGSSWCERREMQDPATAG